MQEILRAVWRVCESQDLYFMKNNENENTSFSQFAEVFLLPSRWSFLFNKEMYQSNFNSALEGIKGEWVYHIFWYNLLCKKIYLTYYPLMQFTYKWLLVHCKSMCLTFWLVNYTRSIVQKVQQIVKVAMDRGSLTDLQDCWVGKAKGQKISSNEF